MLFGVKYFRFSFCPVDCTEVARSSVRGVISTGLPGPAKEVDQWPEKKSHAVLGKIRALMSSRNQCEWNFTGATSERTWPMTHWRQTPAGVSGHEKRRGCHTVRLEHVKIGIAVDCDQLQEIAATSQDRHRTCLLIELWTARLHVFFSCTSRWP